LMGHYLEPYLSAPIFVFEWQFDLAQLYHETTHRVLRRRSRTRRRAATT
jgi:hypothetical protein